MADIAFTADAPAASHISFTAEESAPSPQEEELNTQIGGETGAGEMAGSLISGTAGQIVGGLGMAGKAATNAAGLTTGDPLDVARGISGAMTYQPRTEEGQGGMEALGRGMAALDRPIERAEDYLDPSGNLKATAQDVAERGNYVAGAAQAVAPFLRAPEATIPGPRPPAPPKAAPGPLTAEDLRASPERLPAPTTNAPAPQAPVPGAQTPGKLRVRLKPQGEPAPATPAAEAPVLKAPARDEAELSSGTAPSSQEQAERVSAVQRLQEDTGAVMPHVRKSAVTGDFRETGTDHQLAELGDPTMRAQIDSENAALKTASQAQVDSTGGKARGMGQGALEARGTTIDRALQGIGDWFDTNIRQLYKTADAQAGGVPMQKFNNLQSLLGDHSQFTGVEGRQLHNDIAQVAQQFGMMGQDGFWKPTTVATTEKFRQWLGEQYSPRTGRTIARLKDAIDDDVAAHGGQGLYDAGRALRYRRDQFLEGPTGIRKLMPDKLPDGRLINRPVPLDKVADHIANLPREQFDHIINVLHDSAKLGKGELAEGNAAAINELRRHMAETLHEAGSGGRDGQWNPHNYHDQLDAYSTKLPAVFSPEGLRRFNTIHDAGNALRVNKRYPGAAKQIMQAGGLRAIAGDRIAHMVEGAVSGALGPVGGALTEAVGAGRMLRAPIQKLISGNPEARQAAKVGERMQPLGARIGGGKQRGAVGLLNKPGIEHEHAPETGEHTVTSPNGETLAFDKGKDIQVSRADTHQEARGGGEATVRHEKLIDAAAKRGGRVLSDTSVSPGQVKMYSGLARRGYDVQLNPNATRTTGQPKIAEDGTIARGANGDPIMEPGYVSDDPRNPVFTVGPRKTAAPTSQRGGPEFLARRNPSTGQPSRYPNPAQPTPVQPPADLAGKFPGQRGGPKFTPKAEPAEAGEPAIQTVYRAGGSSARYGVAGGPTFFSEKPAGALPYGAPETYTISPKSVFDTTNIEHRKLYQQFQEETGHPAGYKGNYPFWTAEPELKKWLDSKGQKFDAIKFGENTGHASYAVYDKSNIMSAEPATVNIGLHQGNPGEPGFRKMSKQEATKALAATGAKVGKTSVVTSNSEPTLVADISRRLTDAEAHGVASQLKQTAIAQRSASGEGSMHGPGVNSVEANAQGWDTYNPDYFREHNGKTVSENATEFNPEELEKEGFTPHPTQTVKNAVRNSFPGIYHPPAEVLGRLKVAPEDPIMRQLFGVGRKDLHDTAMGREGNLPGELPGAAVKPKGSKAASSVMTKENEDRLVNVLNEAKKNPELLHGMVGWYVMDPLYKKVVEHLGEKAAPTAYARLNTLMGMASPGSDVMTEINRGTAAHMMASKGEFDKFLRHGGTAEGNRGKNFPPELEDVKGHPYHRTAQGIPMANYLRTGEVQMKSPKVPMYIQASGVPETGFQTRTPVGDAHWSRGVGLSDVRTAQSFGSSVRNPEMSALKDWYREKVAKRAGLPAVSAQALQWGALGGETGVETAVGAPKLELFAQQIKKAAERVGVKPEVMLERVIKGMAHAG